MWGRTTIGALALMASPALAEPGDATPLFADDTPLDVSLSGPIADIVRNAEKSKDPHPARMSAAGETLSIALSARGQSRRKRGTCSFPPLLIDIDDKPGEDSLFYRQNRIKLVTHCNSGSSSEQHALREYAAYRLYNAITPESLKVRLVRVSYEGVANAKEPKWGFLIEDADDAARRLGMKEIDVDRLSLPAMNREDAARYSLFQYLIGNNDWAMFRGSEPGDCCHNSKLLGATSEARTDITPVPYDFDQSGLVDAPYAYADPKLGIRTVRQRVYRGFCSFNAETLRQAAEFRNKRPALEAEIAAIPGLKSGTRKALDRYLVSFFKSIETDEEIERRALRRCRD